MKTKQWTWWMMATAIVLGAPMGGRSQEGGTVECATQAESAVRASGHLRTTKGKGGKTGLILHYSFGKGGGWKSGTVVRDLSGRGHDGRVEGDGLEAVEGFGKRETAARFDGKGDFIRVPRDAELEPQELTVAAWIRMREGDMWKDAATIAFKRNSSFHHNEGYDLELFPDRTARSTVSGPNAAQSRIQSTVPMSNGVWHHVAMTHRPGETRLYIDGAPAGTGSYPGTVVHNAEADLLIGGRDHAGYPMGNYGMYDLGEIKIWNEVMDAEEIARLHARLAGRPGVGAAGTDWKALAEFGVDRRLDSHGIVPERETACGESIPACRPPRVFPPWTPGADAPGLAAELKALVAQGRRDRAASPEFLVALEALLEKHAADGTPQDRLPLKPSFRGPGMPTGWNAVDPSVWRFGDGMARQVESKPNTRYVLFYEPGMEWTDYEVTFRFESDAWFAPPANSGAELYVRYRSTADAYRLDWNGNGYLSAIDCGTAGERTIVRTFLGEETIRDGKPWVVRMQGDEMTVWHEGKQYLAWHDKMHRRGTVGLESIHIPVAFSGLEVTAP